MELDECVALLKKDVAAELTIEFTLDHAALGSAWTIRFRRSEDQTVQPDEVEVEVDLKHSDWALNTSQWRFFDLSWLQAQIEFTSPLLVLALPRDREGFDPDAWNAIVALASRCGQLSTAELTIVSDAVEMVGATCWRRPY